MLAVTAHNKLHNWRFCLPMMRARRYVKGQLLTTPGLIRSVTAVSSPTEFLTLTIWESRQAMFNFMSSGAHEKFLWMFSHWSASFWSMRWLPTTVEEGAWEGLSLANLVKPEDQNVSAALPYVPQLPLVEQRPGRASRTRFTDPGGSGVYAITALVKATNPRSLWSLLSTVREFRRQSGHLQLLGWSVGSADPGLFLILTLWRAAFEGPTAMVQMLHQLLNASWMMCWSAGEYEIGHWNGLRLRQLASARNRQQVYET